MAEVRQAGDSVVSDPGMMQAEEVDTVDLTFALDGWMKGGRHFVGEGQVHRLIRSK